MISKRVVGVAAVVLVIVIGAAIWILVREKWEELPGGPRVSISQLLTAQPNLVPGVEVGSSITSYTIGTTAVYGVYLDGTKLGTYKFKLAEETTFQGVKCLKVETTVSASFMGTTATAQGYTLYDMDLKPRYFTYTETGMSMEYTWDYAENKVRYRITMDGQTMENETTMPIFVGSIENIENLYVGYSENFTYGIDNLLTSTMTVSVPREEDVTVLKGTFHCHVVEISVPMFGQAFTSISVWVDEEGIVPQLEITFFEVLTTTLKLERYGIAR